MTRNFRTIVMQAVAGLAILSACTHGEGMGGAGDYDEEEQRLKDSLANDPHHREYYLKQIPFTEEQLAASNQLLCDGLYHGRRPARTHLFQWWRPDGRFW